MKNFFRTFGLIVLRAVLVTAIVVLCVAAAWAVSIVCANAFGAIAAGLATLAKAVWAWDWWNKILAVCVMLGMTYILQAIITAWNKRKNKNSVN